MPRRGKKISPSRRDRFLRLLESHGIKAAASEVGIRPSTAYKIRREHDHYNELAKTTMAIAKNFEKVIQEPAFSSEIPDCLGSAMFKNMAGTELAHLEIVDEVKAADLFAHLKEEFSELEDIDSWQYLQISKITSSFVYRLELKANEGRFKGRCPHCPK